MSSSWIDDDKLASVDEIDRKFEDNFVTNNKEIGSFQKLDDSEQYLKILQTRLDKIKKNPTVLGQLREKREDLVGNLLNSSSLRITTEKDLELDENIESNKILSHLIPEQPQTIGEIVHLVKHDQLDLEKRDEDEA